RANRFLSRSVEMNEQDTTLPLLVLAVFGPFAVASIYSDLSGGLRILVGCLLLALIVGGPLVYIQYFSRQGREGRKMREQIFQIPHELKVPGKESVLLGEESDLKMPIYLPDHIRCRHVHILGATGSGKTESVILNLVKQDIDRGLGAIIADAKGDISF